MQVRKKKCVLRKKSYETTPTLTAQTIMGPVGSLLNGTAVNYHDVKLRFKSKFGLKSPYRHCNHYGTIGSVLISECMSLPSMDSMVPQDSVKAIGSAVCVGPGLFLSADHVISDQATDFASGKCTTHVMTTLFNRALMWDVYSIHRVPSSDLVLLSTKLNSQCAGTGDFFKIPITTRSPSVGEKIWLCGNRQTKNISEIQPRIVDIYTSFDLSMGVVTDIYPNGRGQLSPGACYAVNSPALSGMSGGAALDEFGNLIGIISRGLDSKDSAGKTIGYAIVTNIWRSLTKFCKIQWPFDVIYEGNLLDFSKEGLCSIDRPEAIIGSKDGDNIIYIYNSW
jgi:hypothetical protein